MDFKKRKAAYSNNFWWWCLIAFFEVEVGTARFMEDETQNGKRNANRNRGWWGNYRQLVEIEKIKFLGISRYKVELRF